MWIFACKGFYKVEKKSQGPQVAWELDVGIDVVATVYFDAKDGKMSIFVSTSDLRLKKPLLVVDLDLSKLLPKDVFVGFSASTGVYTQVNTKRSWNFSS